MSELVKLTINDQEIAVPKGTNLIEAAKKAGADVPHFCYHSHLPVAGNCRMCMVEVEGMRGLPIGCNTVCSEGMKVDTESEAVKEARAAVMEFLLVNHPIDCPVCDQAGECKLQTYYMAHDRRESVVAVDDKVKKGKAIEVGPRVMLDQERCVACTRCIRFCDHVTGTGELRLMNRGDHTTIDTFPGMALNNDYSVNTVDVCPVGALTSRDFRFQARAWYLEEDDALCPGCATGCNVTMSHYKQVELSDYNGVAYRLKPRINDDVNQAWMCDAGRREYLTVNDERLTQPAAHSIEIGWDGALGHVRNLLAPLVARNEGLIAGVASYDCTNEELYVFKKLMREVFGQEEIAIIGLRPDGKADELLMDADKHPNRRGAELVVGAAAAEDLAEYLVGKAAVLTLNADVLGSLDAESASAHYEAIKHKIVMSVSANETADRATIALPTVSFVEKDGTWVNRQGRVQRIRRILRKNFDCKPDLAVLFALAAAMGANWEEKLAVDVFAELATELSAFSGLSYGKIGKLGALVQVDNALAVKEKA